MAKNTVQGIPSQSFSNMNPVPMDQVEYRGHATGLHMPDGTLLAFPRINSHQGVVRILARTLKAEVVIIKGTWKFIPDVESDEDEGSDND